MGRAIEQEVEGRGGKRKRWERKTSRVWAQSSAKKGCGYREVPGKRRGGCRRELGADGGGLGWGQQVWSSILRATLGCQVTLEMSLNPLSLSILSEAVQRGPKAVLYVTHSVLQSNRLRRHSPRWLSKPMRIHRDPAAIVTQASRALQDHS